MRTVIENEGEGDLSRVGREPEPKTCDSPSPLRIFAIVLAGACSPSGTLPKTRKQLSAVSAMPCPQPQSTQTIKHITISYTQVGSSAKSNSEPGATGVLENWLTCTPLNSGCHTEACWISGCPHGFRHQLASASSNVSASTAVGVPGWSSIISR